MDKNTEIKEITLNPRFLTNDVYESLKNQGLAKNFANPVQSGWGGWIRTNECRHQKPMPYHLATPQFLLVKLLI